MLARCSLLRAACRPCCLRVYANQGGKSRCRFISPQGGAARASGIHGRGRSRACCTAPGTEAAPPPVEQPGEESQPLPTGALDLRVGLIKSCEMHPDADGLYVESIDVGEGEPRTIISGLVKYVPLEAMQGRLVVVICNLKARNMRGIKSHGMVLCASNADHTTVEPLCPPVDAQVGERIFFEENQPAPEKENRVQKKKMWEAVQPDLRTTDDKVACYKTHEMRTQAGPVTSSTLTNAVIS